MTVGEPKDAYMEDVKRRVRRNQAFQQGGIECHCDPPGSGEEHCTGHCVLRAEIERLTIDNRRLTEMWDADRETLTVEIERLRIELHRVAESRRGQRERAECAEAENGRLRAALELADEVARLLADEGSWHEEIAEEDSCEAGNSDGGTSRNCPHCHHQQRGQAIDALLTRWDTANKALDGPLIESSEERN